MDGDNMRPDACSPHRRGVPHLDPENYADDLEAFDFDEARGREFLQALWNLLWMCSDIDLGQDPVSLICGQNEKPGLSGPFAVSSVVKSEVNSTPENSDKKEVP